MTESAIEWATRLVFDYAAEHGQLPGWYLVKRQPCALNVSYCGAAGTPCVGCQRDGTRAELPELPEEHTTGRWEQVGIVGGEAVVTWVDE